MMRGAIAMRVLNRAGFHLPTTSFGVKNFRHADWICPVFLMT
jgi:hypothetical protein